MSASSQHHRKRKCDPAIHAGSELPGHLGGHTDVATVENESLEETRSKHKKKSHKKHKHRSQKHKCVGISGDFHVPQTTVSKGAKHKHVNTIIYLFIV